MKTLIKVQAVVSAIEDLTLSTKEYQSTFHYQDDRTMLIKTYCIEHTLRLTSTLAHGNGYFIYLKNNKTIEVLELPFDDVKNSED